MGGTEVVGVIGVRPRVWEGWFPTDPGDPSDRARDGTDEGNAGCLHLEVVQALGLSSSKVSLGAGFGVAPKVSPGLDSCGRICVFIISGCFLYQIMKLRHEKITCFQCTFN